MALRLYRVKELAKFGVTAFAFRHWKAMSKLYGVLLLLMKSSLQVIFSMLYAIQFV